MDSTLALYANFGVALGLAGVVAYFAFLDGDGDDGEDEMNMDADTDAPGQDDASGDDGVLIEDLIAGAATQEEDASPDLRSSIAAAETLEGGDGADTLDGAADNVSRAYDGGAGDDAILAAKQADVADGGDGNDTIRPAAGDDLSYGGAGDDLIVDGFGRDIHFGGEGDDTLSGGADGDFLQGGSGADSITGGGGSDFLAGGSDNDVIDGRASQGDAPKDDGVDSLFGGSGDDQLFLDNGDQATGGDGADIFTIDEAAAGDGTVTITDFDAQADSIAIEYTGGEGVEEPTVTFSPLDDVGVQIALGDQPIATVSGVDEIDPARVALVDKTEDGSEALA